MRLYSHCTRIVHKCYQSTLSPIICVHKIVRHSSVSSNRCLLPTTLNYHLIPVHFSSTSKVMSLFDVQKDQFHCIALDLRQTKHLCEELDFEKRISDSVAFWTSDGVRAVTVFIPSSLASRIQTLVKFGFDFHHAQPGYVLMIKWLSETENNFPQYANQYLGVAGFVVNDMDELLVIKEKYTGIEARWKFPGGGADTGEELAVTAEREVFEETGIRSKFVGVLCFRHQHKFRYNCSDFYHVCLMKALTTDITKCENEILDCRWMKMKDVGESNLYPTNRFAFDSYIKYKETGVLIGGHSIPSYTGKSYHMAYTPGRPGQPDTDEEHKLSDP